MNRAFTFMLLALGVATAAEPTLLRDPGGVTGRKEPFAFGLGIGSPWGGSLILSLPEWGMDREGAGTLWSYNDAQTSLWSVAADGRSATLAADSKGKPGVFLLGKALVQAPDKVRIEMTIDNRTDAPARGFIMSFCTFYRLATGFPAWQKGFSHTYVIIGGKPVLLSDTKATDPSSLIRGALVAGTDTPEVSAFSREHKGDIADKLDIPLIVIESLDGKHRIAMSWTPVGQMLSNNDNPCMHCDPRFAEAPAHGTSVAHGVIWFTDQTVTDIAAKFISGELAANPSAEKKGN